MAKPDPLPERFRFGYSALATAQDNVGRLTEERHADLVNQWLMCLHLLQDAFSGVRAYEFHGSVEEWPGARPHNLRQQLLGLAGRTSKPAFDLMAGGYYSEGCALVRAMLEAWGRAVYVRLRPLEFGRWYAPTGEELRESGRAAKTSAEAAAKGEPSFSGEIAGVVEKDGDEHDRRVFREADMRYRLLSELAHVSGQSITQTHDTDAGRFVFGPDYREELCRHGFNHGIFAQLLLLDEIDRLGDHPDEWRALLATVGHYFDKIHASIQGVIDEKAREVAAERAAKARPSEREEAPGETPPSHQDLREAWATIARWQAAATAMEVPLEAPATSEPPCAPCGGEASLDRRTGGH